MKEQLITFETAKLANEKGFKEKTLEGYVVPPEFYGEKTGQLTNSGSGYHKDMIGLIAAPTQSILQRWLRELHKKIVLVKFHCDGDNYEDVRYIVEVSEFEHFKTHDSFVSTEFSNYEKCLEKGLFEALKLIK